MAKTKRTKRQTIVCKTQYRTIKTINQSKTNPPEIGVFSGALKILLNIWQKFAKYLTSFTDIRVLRILI